MSEKMFTDKQADDIRRNKSTALVLADVYGTSAFTISKIRNFKSPYQHADCLRTVGKLTVPSNVKLHRFVRECIAAVKVIDEDRVRSAGVVGTANIALPELYGWNPNIAPHKDEQGYCYVMPITGAGGYIHCDGAKRIRLAIGSIIRLDDRRMHWTTQDKRTAAIFVGCFSSPRDELAVKLISEALGALSAGKYYEAPRVSSGYRALLPDECFVLQDDCTCGVKLVADIKPDHDIVAYCSHGNCQKPAVSLDSHYPYHQEHNSCADHMRIDGLDRI